MLNIISQYGRIGRNFFIPKISFPMAGSLLIEASESLPVSELLSTVQKLPPGCPQCLTWEPFNGPLVNERSGSNSNTRGYGEVVQRPQDALFSDVSGYRAVPSQKPKCVC